MSAGKSARPAGFQHRGGNRCRCQSRLGRCQGHRLDRNRCSGSLIGRVGMGPKGNDRGRGCVGCPGYSGLARHHRRRGRRGHLRSEWPMCRHFGSLPRRPGQTRGRHWPACEFRERRGGEVCCHRHHRWQRNRSGGPGVGQDCIWPPWFHQRRLCPTAEYRVRRCIRQNRAVSQWRWQGLAHDRHICRVRPQRSPARGKDRFGDQRRSGNNRAHRHPLRRQLCIFGHRFGHVVRGSLWDRQISLGVGAQVDIRGFDLILPGQVGKCH